MKCGQCGAPTFSLVGDRCKFCRREGLVARLWWWLHPDLMRRVRWRQNFRAGGWW